MYILYNQDGSIKKKKLTDFIQKGNNGVNTIFIAIEGMPSNQWSPTGYFELPDGTLVLLTASESTQTIDGKSYSGVTIPILASVTPIVGNVKFSLQLVNLQSQTLATFETTLVINPSTAVPDVTTITLAQYNALMDYILSRTNPVDKIIVFENLNDIDLTGYEVGQLFLNKATGRFGEVIDSDGNYQEYEVDYVHKKTTEGLHAYGHAGSTEYELPVDNSPTGSTIVLRESDGRVKAGTPSQDNDAATKKYVDDKVFDATITIEISSLPRTLTENELYLANNTNARIHYNGRYYDKALKRAGTIVFACSELQFEDNLSDENGNYSEIIQRKLLVDDTTGVVSTSNGNIDFYSRDQLDTKVTCYTEQEVLDILEGGSL